MSDKKNIDRLFQENLKDFAAAPSDAVWENIHNALHEDKRKRRVLIPLWWRIGGVAAILALLFAVGFSVLNDTDAESNLPVVNTDKNVIDSIEENKIDDFGSDKLVKDAVVNSDINTNKLNDKDDDTNLDNLNDLGTSKSGSVANNNTKNRKSLNSNPIITNTSNLNNKTDATSKNSVAKQSSNLPEPNLKNEANSKHEGLNLINKEDLSNPQNAIVKNTEENPNTETEPVTEIEDLAKIEESPSIEEAIALAENTNEEEKEEEKLNRWNISPSVAPVYFNTLGEGSSIHDQFIGNSKNGDVNMSYGLGGSYAINKKIKVRAGIHKVNLGYDTNNVIAYSGIGARNNGTSNIKFNNNVNATSFISADSFDLNTAPEILNTNLKGSLEQRLGFVEIPLEIEYSLVDKKIGLNVIGGFSTLFLSKNEIYSNLEGERTLIGEATNVNSTSYSANFGIGVNYNVSEKIKVNLEPTFKYQINTFNNSSGDFQPYFIGVYTGLSYKF